MDGPLRSFYVQEQLEKAAIKIFFLKGQAITLFVISEDLLKRGTKP